MGSEQSTAANRHAQAANAAAQQQRHVERILEAQRELYEKRCKELLKEQATRQAAAAERSPPQTNMPAPKPKPTPTPTSQAIPPRVNNTTPHAIPSLMDTLIRPPVPAPRPTTPQRVNISSPQPFLPSPLENQNNFERNRTPYNYSVRDFHNARETVSPGYTTFSLYPNLNNNEVSRTAGPSTTPSTFSFNRIANNNSTNSPVSSFVFVNRNGSERSRPSAPPAPRDRSVSRTRNSNNEDRDLNCPTCSNIFGLYIYQCASGHSSCKFCKERATPCGLCGQPITDMRNIALEAYISERKVPCINKSDGCALVIKLADMENHAKECPFKEMECPMNTLLGRCPWKGKLNQLVVHFDHIHYEHRHAEEGQELHLPNICSENRFVFLIVKGNFHFLIHLWVSEKDRMIYITTQLIGTKCSAQKWTYDVQFYNKREPRRKYQYVDVCNSWNEPINDIYKESRCATLPVSYAMNFVNEGAICYKFTFDKTFKARNVIPNKNYRGRGGKRQG